MEFPPRRPVAVNNLHQCAGGGSASQFGNCSCQGGHYCFDASSPSHFKHFSHGDWYPSPTGRGRAMRSWHGCCLMSTETEAQDDAEFSTGMPAYFMNVKH